MSGHTPGPWKVTPDSFVMTDARPSIGIARVITHAPGFPENARLIAAAPDYEVAAEALQSALARVVGLLQTAVRGLPVRDMTEALAECCSAQEKYNAAKTKAEGRS